MTSFTVAAVLTVALGIGANTAIFSAVNSIMLRRLPVERPVELISLAAVFPNGVEPVFSYSAYRRIATDAAHLIDALAASTVRRDAVTLDGPPEPVDIMWVSGNYFSVLGIAAAIGRTVLPSDDPFPPGEPVAVQSTSGCRCRRSPVHPRGCGAGTARLGYESSGVDGPISASLRLGRDWSPCTSVSGTISQPAQTARSSAEAC